MVDDKGGAAKYTNPNGLSFANKEAALLHLGLIAAVTRSEAADHASAYRARLHTLTSIPHPLSGPPLPRAQKLQWRVARKGGCGLREGGKGVWGVCGTCLVWPGARSAAFIAAFRQRDLCLKAKRFRKTKWEFTVKRTWHDCLFVGHDFYSKLVLAR